MSTVPTGGSVRELAEGNWNQFFPGASDPANYDFDLSLHSMTPSADGTRTYLAYLHRLIDWAAGRYDAALTVTSGIVPARQPPATLKSFAAVVAAQDEFHLTRLA